jgi:anti-anti-sigma factor
MLDMQVTGSETVEVAVRGELDMEHAPSLRSLLTALLNRGDVTRINLDLAGVTFVDATCVGTLIVAQRIAANVRVDLRLTALSPPAAHVPALMAAADPVGPTVAPGSVAVAARAKATPVLNRRG